MPTTELTQDTEDVRSSQQEVVEKAQHPDSLSQISLSDCEQMHLSEVERANKERTCRDKKLVELSKEVHMLSSHSRSGLLKGHELRENARRVEKAKGQYRDLLAIRHHQIERPYREALSNYRSWQESQGQQFECVVESAEKLTPLAKITSARKPMPVVCVTPSTAEARSVALAKLQASVGFVDADQSDSAHAFAWQTAGLLPPEVWETEPKHEIDWTKCVPGIHNLAEPGLRGLYNKRRNETLAQASGQTLIDPATGGADIDSGYFESKPDTPVKELATYIE
ncbi:hypothetical protein N0V82_006246 [Gnomoniopsis sp. IMI 355080]|nr:hypothetical protein N0V82_006246 [Gnomoniopsis sp. IMI 355080]